MYNAQVATEQVGIGKHVLERVEMELVQVLLRFPEGNVSRTILQ